MATLPYSDRTDTYSTTTAVQDAGGYGETTAAGVGGKIFIWLAWAFAAAFWAFSLSTGIGILNAMGSPAADATAGAVDAGGIGWFLMTVVGGTVVLGVAIAYGLASYLSRDKRKDPMTEAATHALYDTIERQGGDDMTTRSPEERRPEERDAYRDAQRDLR